METTQAALMNNKVIHGLMVRDNLNEVVGKMLEGEQAECPVIHRFGPGVYIREMSVKAGAVVVGHKHKFEHTCVMLTGRAIFLNEDGTTTEMVAPQTFVAKPGNKIAYVVEDMTFQNIFATTETDVETLETHFLDKPEFWNEHIEGRKKLLQLRHDADVEDFKLAIAEFSFTEDEVWQISRNESDLIDLPYGGFKIKVGNSFIQGRGLFATATINKDEVFAPARIGDKRTIAGRFTNHSRYPNARMARGPDGNVYLVALTEIKGCCGGYDGDEITIDYRQALRLAFQLALEV